MIQKLLLQTMIGKLGLGNNHQSACSHVQTMDDERTGSFLVLPAHQSVDGRLGCIFPGNGEQSFGLIDDSQLAVFVKRFHLIIYSSLGLLGFKDLLRQHPM